MRLRLLFMTAALGMAVFASDVRACWWCCCGGGGSYGGGYSSGYQTYGGWGYYPGGGAVYSYGDPVYAPGTVIIRAEKPAESVTTTDSNVTKASATTTNGFVNSAGVYTPSKTYVVPAGYSSSYYVPTYYTTPGYYSSGYYYPATRGYYGSPGWYSTPYYSGWGGSYYGGGYGVFIR